MLQIEQIIVSQSKPENKVSMDVYSKLFFNLLYVMDDHKKITTPILKSLKKILWPQ